MTVSCFAGHGKITAWAVLKCAARTDKGTNGYPQHQVTYLMSCTPSRDRDVGETGNTVFIDASALGELSSHLTQQDLEALVGLNIQAAADFEALDEPTDAHVVDTSGVLISDGVTVGNIVEVAGGEGVDEHEHLESQTHHQTSHHQPMEVDALTQHTQVIGDMDMLQQGSELITMAGEELSAGGEAGTAAVLAAVSSEGDNNSHQIVTEAPQVIKGNLGQFVVLQQNQQNSISLGSMNNRIITSGGQVVSTVGGLNNSSNKPVVVNTSQLGGSLRQQMVVTQPTPQTQQVRTVQFKQTPHTQSLNSGTVTKVIITSQAGGGIGTMGGQQVQLVTSQSGSGGSAQVVSSPTKLTLQQAQRMGLISPTKPLNQSPNKQIVVQRVSMGGVSPMKSPSKLIPVSMATKSPTKIAPAPPTGQQQIITHQISSGGAVRNILSSPQKIVIKSSVPQPGQGTVSTVRTGQIVTSGGQQVIKIPASQVQQLTGQPQNVQVLSNKMNYVRLVNPGVGGGGGGGGTTLIRPTPSTNKPIAPAASQPIKIKAMPITHNQQTNKQRVIIPVSGSVTTSSMGGGVPIRPQTNLTLPASALPPGVLSNTQPGSVVMIPAHYMSQLQSSTSNNTTVQMSNQPPPGTIIPQPPKPQPPRTVIDANGIRPRKPCNCTKSQCLKLYCDCFANGEFCNNCNCANCFNNLTHEEDRQKAIKACLDRNPQAFRPKIGKGGSDNERRHNKGCNCKRSGCLKNYCECYEAKIPCSNMCKCVGCKNVDMNPAVERKGLMQLAECAEARVNQQKAVKSKLPSFSHHSPTKMLLPTSSRSGYCRMNQEVVEATCQCLLAQADKAENALVSKAQLEHTVIAEFSRCLMQIIGSYTSRSRETLLQTQHHQHENEMEAIKKKRARSNCRDLGLRALQWGKTDINYQNFPRGK
ncbi:protein lin-54 homolog isoform X3 [Cherax quadricarinatus]|uniref:protein lin-54 homolog isoform X3 n=1 Tax=Cherax quadricarinatus TaxID=27406 RepID=UPI002377D8D9|nr:protein lin-54 homolog isoform X3 [Cherax quadricarinatus]